MRIGLGTAQFGFEYGITNKAGRVAPDEVLRILALAGSMGVDTIDTAATYGESESTLGSSGAADYKVITKTPTFGGVASESQARNELRAALFRSLERLRCARVYGLLIHDAADLLGPYGPGLWQEMQELKKEGLVTAVGCSFYEGADIDEALELHPLDIAQLPFNPLDQRLVDGGQLRRLSDAGVEIHARSLFLQGLLLQEPSVTQPKFAPLASAVEQMRVVFENARLNMLEGILALVFQRREIHRFICGVTSAQELQQIAAAADKAERLSEKIDIWLPRDLDARLLNPSRWGDLPG